MKHDKINNRREAMKNSKTSNRKGSRIDRVTRVCEAHPVLKPVYVRMLLIAEYQKLSREGVTDYRLMQGWLDAMTDKLIDLTDAEAEKLAERMSDNKF